jgi:Protein of unknown function (DUF3105)
MSKTPPRRGDQRPQPGGARRPAAPAAAPPPQRTNRASSNANRPARADDQYDQYEQDDRGYRPPRQSARNAPPPRRPAPSRYGPPQRQRYAPPPRRDAFPMIMGGIVGALVVGLLIVIYMLLNRNSGTTNPIVAAQPTVDANAASANGAVQPTSADMSQPTTAAVNVPGTQTMAANRPAGGLGTAIPDEGNAHVSDGETITYKNYPPSSGTHYSSPQDAGYYDTTIPEGKFVHSMEHGYVVLYYKPDLPDATKEQLKSLMTALPLGKYGKVKMVIVPYTNMSTPLTVAAWDRLLPMDSYNFDVIKAFYQQYVDKGPEDVP